MKKVEEDVKTAVTTNAVTAKCTADQALTKSIEVLREAKKC